MASFTIIVCLLFKDLWGNIDYTGLSKAGIWIFVVECISSTRNLYVNAKFEFEYSYYIILIIMIRNQII